jgi:hypothetical protein
MSHMVAKYFRKGCVLAFAAGSTILAGMEEAMVHAVVHSTTAEEETDGEVEIRLK